MADISIRALGSIKSFYKAKNYRDKGYNRL